MRGNLLMMRLKHTRPSGVLTIPKSIMVGPLMKPIIKRRLRD